jgi:prevent-host-death family protein
MATQSVSYVKAHLAEVIDSVRASHDALIITQNGANTAVIVDHESYQRTRQALAMLKLLAMGEQDIAKGRTVPQAEVFASLKRDLKQEQQTKTIKSVERKVNK